MLGYRLYFRAPIRYEAKGRATMQAGALTAYTWQRFYYYFWRFRRLPG
jgi:hypothetical protein